MSNRQAAAPIPGVSRRSSLQRLTILNTAASSNNLGDYVIMAGVRDGLDGLFDGASVLEVTSHQPMGWYHRGEVHASDWTIAGGTSLISSHMWWKPSWALEPLDALADLRVVTMGVGWHAYQGPPDPYSAWLIRGVLHKTALHSVRDSYTLKKLQGLGLRNVINTGCPTMWRLTPEHCAKVPRQKAASVVTTINSYPKLKNPELDREMFRLLRRHYQDVYCWIQTDSDFEYAHALDPDLLFIDPSLEAYDRVLSSDLDLDYMGNRLHAGMRALQKGRRTVIVEIDNRAAEIGSDFNVPTVQRSEFDRLETMIQQPFETAVRLPTAEIERWRAQFKTPA